MKLWRFQDYEECPRYPETKKRNILQFPVSSTSVTWEKSMASKLTKRVELIDSMVLRKCNCIVPRGNGQYQQYGYMCRVLIVIYNITCKMMTKIYIRNTQQNFKKRMTCHFQDVKKLTEKGVHSDSYTRHFSLVFGQEEQHHHHRGCSNIS
jgi:hypothetical protein